MKNLIIAVLLALGSWGCASVQSAAPLSTPPLGLWVWQNEPNEAERSLSIQMRDGRWQADLDGRQLTVAVHDGMLRIEAQDGRRFAGELSRDSSAIEGTWIQSADPLGYQDVATPIALSRVGRDRWQAAFLEQPRPYTVYLDIFQHFETGLNAVVRNPERNDLQSATRFTVESAGTDRWILNARRGGREVQRMLVRTGRNQLALEHDQFQDRISLRPAREEDARQYFARQPTGNPSLYTVPTQLDDGWTVVAPEIAGFDRQALDRLVAELADVDPRSRSPQMIHSLLVAHEGRLVFEEYFHGHGREMVHDTRSLSKVFGPVLIGAMRQQGYTIDADMRPVESILAGSGLPIGDRRKRDITLGHLMTFTSGLDCDVNRDSLGSEERMWEQQDQGDFWLYTASLPLLHPPGTHYAYCSGSSNLVGAAIESVADEPVYTVFDRLIAQPLQFAPYHWPLAPNGAPYLGGGVYMRPRDMLKIGAVFASGGVWDGRQIIEDDWLQESTTSKVAISPETTGFDPDTFGNTYFGGEQAYVWVVNTIETTTGSYRSYQASGNGGQLLIVIPELDLAVAMTGGNYRMGGIWGRWRNQIVGGHIIPALLEEN